ncbi:MAG: aminotransferase class I/II-fold pyridoxal phosphate-dependent enzyme [Planctomycetes bacterium]|nr:aminotransferase class I/II-fold pyridoxal phosphate-dependent enzyme [Planctomycetota bacterium]MBI3846484.1 aminotransferase class I/II-fold pyridoxal phosphate-dependent enzyme [Planctomycetota bacterium]
MALFDKCRKFTRARELMAEQLYPYFHPIAENSCSEVSIDGRRLIMIGSNNYLGLTHHPKVKEAARRAIDRYGSGCTGSRFLNGTLDLHEQLEERLAHFMRRESALTFSTGFQTNLGTISTLVGKGEEIFCDRENHASIIDGCRLSFGDIKKFKHNDMEDLERLLSQSPTDVGKLVVVDGVFSMCGDIANLPAIAELAKRFGANVLVDEAHSIGVLGDSGRGAVEYFGVEDSIDIVMGTFSKSFASLGGFIAGKREVLHYIKHHARALIFSASIPPASVAAVLAALEILENEPERRKRLWQIARRMKSEFDRMGFDTAGTQTPIIPIVIGDQLKTFQFWKRLFECGIFANPVTTPAVPPNRDLIRTSYMAAHTDEQLDRVLEVFEKLGKEFGLI